MPLSSSAVSGAVGESSIAPVPAGGTDRLSGVRKVARWFRELTTTAASRPFVVILAASLALSLIVLREVLAIGPFQSADFLPPYFSWEQLDVNAFSSWSYQGTGGPNGASYLLLAMGFVTAATHDPAFAEKLFYFPTIAVSGILAFLLFRYLGLEGWTLILASMGYELCPWFTGVFYAGEPGLVWLYALLPFYLYTLFRIVRNPRRFSNYLLLALAWVLALSATLQSFSVYLPLTIPIFALFISTHGWKVSFKAALGWVGALAAALVTQVSTIQGYLTGASQQGVSGGSGSIIFQNFGFLSVQAIQIKWWILAFTGAAALFYLVRRTSPARRPDVLPLSQLLVSTLYGFLFAAIPSVLAVAIFDNVFILWPFYDFDKFLLIAWLSSLLILVYLICEDQISARLAVDGQAVPYVTVYYQSSRRSAVHRLLFRRVVLATIVGLLISSALLVPIQVLPNPPNGVTYFSGNLPFSEDQIPSYFFELRGYLLQSGASFGLSFHTLLVPQNPGSYDPFYIGEYVVPGFVVPSATLEPVVLGFLNNDSTETAALMALMGIKYVVIAPQVPNPWWPALADGPPSVGSLGSTGALGNAWFPQGNPAAYAAIAGSWASLSLVYKSSDLTIYQNSFYAGPAYSFGSAQSILNLTQGDYNGLYDQTPTGVSLVKNPNLTRPLSNWSVNPSANDTLLSNGTMRLAPGSTGMSVEQSIVLSSQTRYVLSFRLQTSPGYDSLAPANSTPTYAGVYWNSGTGATVVGAFVTSEFLGNFSGESTFTFVTPQAVDGIPALIILYAEPPMGPLPIFTTYANVTLIPINGSDTFPSMVHPAPLQVSGLTSFNFPSNPGWNDGYSLTIDTAYGPSWRGTLSDGLTVSPVLGPFGLLTFRVPSNTTILSVFEPTQTDYLIIQASGIAGFLIIIGAAIGVVIFEWRWPAGRRTFKETGGLPQRRVASEEMGLPKPRSTQNPSDPIDSPPPRASGPTR
jgi:hypothetical protein